jgi:membrane protein required for colicin V production
MNLVDILIWLILAGFVYKGFTKGLVRQVCSLLGFLLGGWAAIKYHADFTEASRQIIQLPHSLATILSFIFIFLIIGLIFYLLGHVITVMFKVILLGGINRVGGVLLGLLEGGFIICLLLYVFASKPFPEKIKGYIIRSKTAAPFLETGRDIVAGWGGLPGLQKTGSEPLKTKPPGAPRK